MSHAAQILALRRTMKKWRYTSLMARQSTWRDSWNPVDGLAKWAYWDGILSTKQFTVLRALSTETQCWHFGGRDAMSKSRDFDAIIAHLRFPTRSRSTYRYVEPILKAILFV